MVEVVRDAVTQRAARLSYLTVRLHVAERHHALAQHAQQSARQVRLAERVPASSCSAVAASPSQ